jgi:DNA polymerase III sliding clamp (beta) subunit (PCNA family)
MRIRYDGAKMLSIMDVVRGLSNDKNSLANNTTITAGGGGITIRHHGGMYTVFQASLACDVVEPGESVVGGCAFYRAVKEAGKKNQEYRTDAAEGKPGGVVSTEGKEIPVHHTGAGTGIDFTRKMLEYGPPEKGWFPVRREVLDALFEKTYRFASEDETRHSMGGVSIENTPGGIRGIATDGRHLVLVELPCKIKSFKAEVWEDPKKHEKGKRPADHIVPLRYIPAIRRLLALSDGWEMLVNKTQLGLRSADGTYTLYAELIDGRFPNWVRVIPGENLVQGETQKSLFLNAPELKAAVKELRPLRKSGSSVTPVHFVLQSGTEAQFEVRSVLSDECMAVRSVGVHTQEEPVKACFNLLHLEHAVACFEGCLKFEWQQPGRAWTITPSLPAGVSRLFMVIMPMNVD